MHTANPTIADLWSAARALFTRMRTRLGEPQAIAALKYIEAEALAHMRAWLRPVEAAVRQLIFLEAAELARQPALPHIPLTRPIGLEYLKLYAPHQLPAPPAPRTRAPSFRLWPRPERSRYRIRSTADPILVRDIFRERARQAQSRQLNMVRFMRTPEPQLIARRIEALTRVLEKPARAIRRLAAKLRAAPKLALKLAVRRWPRSPHADPRLETQLGQRSYDCARRLNPDKPDSS